MMMKYSFQVPEEKKIDLIIDSDVKNEADDQYAIVHALLTPKLNVLGVVATHFSKRRTQTSMLESYNECKIIMDLMPDEAVPIFKGNVEEIIDIKNCELSEGSQFIIEEAHKAKDYITIASLGALTNIAAAILHDPTIKDKIKLIWVGGKSSEDEKTYFEANARNDIVAVNIVMENLQDITIIPAETYKTIQVSIAELECKVKPYAKIGQFLFQQLIDFNYIVNRPWTLGESWSLGDSCAIGYIFNEECATTTMRKGFILDKNLNVTLLDKDIKMVTSIDSRFILEDFFAKLKIYSQ